MNFPYEINNFILHLKVDLTFDHIDNFYEHLMLEKSRIEVIDLKNVKRIDSAGVALLEELMEKYEISLSYQHF